jgi:nucleotide-binding universal stress UspA family protein
VRAFTDREERAPTRVPHGLGVLVGVDGSPGAATALRFAVEEARLRELPLTVCHVVPPGGEGDVDEVLDDALARVGRIAGSVRAAPLREYGHPAGVLAMLAGGAELTVVGSRGRGGFAGLLLGSVGLHVALRAPAPVAVVRPGPSTRRAGPFAGHVVVGVDGSPPSQAALEFGFAEAERRGCGLAAVHVHYLPPEDTYVDDRTLELHEAERAPGRDLLDAAVDPLAVRYPGVPVKRALHHAPAAEGLLRAAAGCTLLAVGRTGQHSAVAGLLFGSVSQAVVHHARCPVALV